MRKSAWPNYWRDLPPGPAAPREVYVLVEIPKGSRNKYEFDEQIGVFKLDRLLYSPFHYPGDYGLIPQTISEDGDPLDALVMVTEPTFTGCLIEARPLGVLRVLDRGVADDKILVAPAHDPLFADYADLGDVPRHFLAEAAHFFKTYKDLEGVGVQLEDWQPAAAAREQIEQAMQRFRSNYPE